MVAAPYMRLYVGDYLADTLHLTTEQHGAYLLLLMSMWRNGGTLPNDPEKLARMARISSKRWNKVWPGIAGFFNAVDGDEGSITQNRLYQEHQKAVQITQKRKPIGSLGGTAKALKNKQTDVANATDLLPYHHHQSQSQSHIDDDDAREAWISALPLKAGMSSPITVKDRVLVGKWIAQGLTPSEVEATIAEVLARKPSQKPPSSLGYFNQSIADLIAAKADTSLPEPSGLRLDLRPAPVDLDAVFAAAMKRDL